MRSELKLVKHSIKRRKFSICIFLYRDFYNVKETEYKKKNAIVYLCANRVTIVRVDTGSILYILTNVSCNP